MKRLIILIGLLFVPWSWAAAQNPANFHLIYGNRDGTPMSVQINSIIEVPMWGATSPGPGDLGDSISFMHNPLASMSAYIPARLGGISDESCDYDFMAPEYNWPYTGYINQSFLRFPFGQDPHDPACLFWTGGDTVWIGTFLARTANDSTLIGQTICPFLEGHSPAQGLTLWGMPDGSRGVSPTQTYGCLYFSPCVFTPGDANNDGIFNGLDVVYGVNYLKGFGSPPPATCECPSRGPVFVGADANGNCVFNGIDITYGVNYLKGIGAAPRRCPSC